METLEDRNTDEEQDEIELMEEKDGAIAGARKRKVGRLDSSKHLVQYNAKWESEFLWLVPKKDIGEVQYRSKKSSHCVVLKRYKVATM